GEAVEWNSREQAVLARRYVRLDAITLEDKPLQDVPADAARAAMLQGVRELGIEALPWNRDARDLQARMEFVRMVLSPATSTVPPSTTSSSAVPVPYWPSVSDAALSATLDDWLVPWLDGITRRDHLARLSMTEILRSILPWDKQRQLDDLAPTHLTVP